MSISTSASSPRCVLLSPRRESGLKKVKLNTDDEKESSNGDPSQSSIREKAFNISSYDDLLQLLCSFNKTDVEDYESKNTKFCLYKFDEKTYAVIVPVYASNGSTRKDNWRRCKGFIPQDTRLTQYLYTDDERPRWSVCSTETRVVVDGNGNGDGGSYPEEFEDALYNVQLHGTAIKFLQLYKFIESFIETPSNSFPERWLDVDVIRITVPYRSHDCGLCEKSFELEDIFNIFSCLVLATKETRLSIKVFELSFEVVEILSELGSSFLIDEEDHVIFRNIFSAFRDLEFIHIISTGVTWLDASSAKHLQLLKTANHVKGVAFSLQQAKGLDTNRDIDALMYNELDVVQFLGSRHKLEYTRMSYAGLEQFQSFADIFKDNALTTQLHTIGFNCLPYFNFPRASESALVSKSYKKVAAAVDASLRRRNLMRLLEGDLEKNRYSFLGRSFFCSSLREVHLLPMITSYLL